MLKRIKELPQNERPREKLLQRGARTLSDHELAAILLGRGSQKSDVLSLARKLVNIIDCRGIGIRPREIMAIQGIGTAGATSIAAAFEFARRRIKPQGLKIKSPSEVLPLLHHYADRRQEHFMVISINGANEVMSVRVATIGLVNQCQVHPREVFADAIAERATAIIVAHNHPSGELNPSPEDMAVTKRLHDAAELLGIKLLDHIIFNTRGYLSMAERGDFQ
ncbi:MAG: hypothetical protein CVV64_14115 [Candidatus Wallbacteria bacterium HGW-Wallbacteria-1]|jgi:DNA repair protein RadC|uniref:MPN domain-containing protein n=1 Tax=Candidatus Wallbacteria bacterium HGW-Wallbacteria-1 TaxID=2013854 RepID=A0A2N1PMH4_9BACT|nr:MAG: hypothetical protein CVV64_14115 [Candidatus Wallbacteria bacterium HGW-Wallbacteria-1]